MIKRIVFSFIVFFLCFKLFLNDIWPANKARGQVTKDGFDWITSSVPASPASYLKP